MLPDDIPAKIAKLVYTAPRCNPRSENDAAEYLAHYWPAIERHVREQVATDIAVYAGAAGRATDQAKVGFLGGMATAEIIARGETPDLVQLIAELRQAPAIARQADDTSKEN